MKNPIKSAINKIYRGISLNHRPYQDRKGILVHRTPRPVLIDQDYLYTLYLNQHGKCFYTDCPLTLVTKHRDKNEMLTHCDEDLINLYKQFCPSVDRLDNTKGYIEGNIVFTTVFMNRAKSNMPFNTFSSLFPMINILNSPQLKCIDLLRRMELKQLLSDYTVKNIPNTSAFINEYESVILQYNSKEESLMNKFRLETQKLYKNRMEYDKTFPSLVR